MPPGGKEPKRTKGSTGASFPFSFFRITSNYCSGWVWHVWVDSVGADDLIIILRTKVITGKNITT